VTHDVRSVADAILYEGYLLYPYRPSALKNHHRYPFGTLYPEAFCAAHQAGDASTARAEVLVVGTPAARIAGEVRFLQLSGPQPAVREAHLPPLALEEIAAERRSTRFELSPISGELSIQAERAGADTWKVCVEVHNRTALAAAERATRDDALALSFASTHLLLSAEQGEFVSLIDPPEHLCTLARSCRNQGWWPVLAGRPPRRDVVLAAPIILYDYPELAPESPGDFFDGTEIDELLTLRVLTLTDEEKREMSASDPRASALLARTEASGLEGLADLHGRLQRTPPLRIGASVRLRPKGRADIFDLALEGKVATVQAIERDLEGRTHVAVTVDEDPGKDLGVYGHRFFFRPEEVEPL
jgi:hypothetical protein